MSVLLTSSDYIKSHSGLNDNTYDKMIVPALERAQDISLEEALGKCLVTALKNKVSDGSIATPENILYKTLLDDYVQPFLTYTVLANITLELGQVMGNGGIDFLTDDHRTSLSFDERGQYKDYWLHCADAYKVKMMNFLKENCNALPEFQSCCKKDEGISAACSIFLGGKGGSFVL